MDSREESRDGKSRVRFAQIPARLVWLQIILMQPTNFAQPFLILSGSLNQNGSTIH